MTLDKLKKGESATIKSINCNNELKNRFYSFGIVKGTEVFVEEQTMTKNTIKIKVNSTKIALRFSEAKTIEVE